MPVITLVSLKVEWSGKSFIILKNMIINKIIKKKTHTLELEVCYEWVVLHEILLKMLSVII